MLSREEVSALITANRRKLKNNRWEGRGLRRSEALASVTATASTFLGIVSSITPCLAMWLVDNERSVVLAFSFKVEQRQNDPLLAARNEMSTLTIDFDRD